MPLVRLILAVHNHQPLGSFPGVFEQAYETSYRPFVDAMEKCDEIPVALHTSGPLLEWMVDQHPEYVERVRRLVEAGRVEILGGGFSEPILTMIPHRDRVGQIRSFTDYLQKLFPTQIRGIWMPDHVWEQNLVTALFEAGVEYTVLDERHFQRCLEPAQNAFGYFLTEYEGRLLKVFPACRALRDGIEFPDPQRLIELLKAMADREPGSTVVVADQGGNFGGRSDASGDRDRQPWLERLRDLMMAHRDWLELATFATAADRSLPIGKIYPGDCSDRCRNFRSRYPESDEMYARMLGISDRLAVADAGSDADPDYLEIARDELYRAQSSGAYWPGPSGGLYLPHLRNTVYRHLIAAHNALDEIDGRTGPRIRVDVGDFNLDARQEVRLENDRLIALVRPAQGGHIYELDVREPLTNVLATLTRRPEPYHAIQHLIHDRHPRKALVDHFFPVEATLDDLVDGRDIDSGDFALGTYQAKVQRQPRRAALIMDRVGRAGEHSIRVRKTIGLSADDPTVCIRYEIEQIPRNECLHFGIEINLAGLAGEASDLYYSDSSGKNLGPLGSRIDLPHASGLSLTDVSLELSVGLAWSQSAGLWCFPIETVGRGHGGFERVHQSSAVIPHWHVIPDDQGRWDVSIRWKLESTAVGAATNLRGGQSASVFTPSTGFRR